MPNKILVILIIALIAVGAYALYAQELLKIKASCSYYGEAISDDLYGFASDAEAQAAVGRIMKYTGLPQNFVIMAANVPNAAAAIRGTDRYLLYNQDFMLRVKDLTHTDWSALSIMAHEIGHHLAGHTLQPGGSRPPTELQADSFSAFVLYRMGATLDEAQIVMKTIASDAGSDTHPPKSARLAAITNGWIQAREQNPVQPTQPPSTPLRVTPAPSLRRDARTISSTEAAKEAFGLNDMWRPRQYVDNQYEDRGAVVVDRATGLTWQKSGSPEALTYEQAQEYVRQLNRQRFAGYADWRLPTIPELMSLLEPTELNGDLYIDPIFDPAQRWCWSADKSSSESAWDVYFRSGGVGWDYLNSSVCVRAVRS